MENMNLGIAKAIIGNKISNEFINESSISSSFANSKTYIGKFTNVLSNSPILMLEYDVINNIENKHIENELLAMKYIDENFKMFSNYQYSDLEKANNQLIGFHSNDDVNNVSKKRKELYESINTLIYETTSGHKPNINKKQDAYTKILNYIITNINENENLSSLDDLDENIDLDSVIEVATSKFNDRFNSLTETEKDILTTIVYGAEDKKIKIFETLKTENIELLNNTMTEGIEDKIHEGISKLNDMTFSEKNIIKLYELKNNLG